MRQKPISAGLSQGFLFSYLYAIFIPINTTTGPNISRFPHGKSSRAEKGFFRDDYLTLGNIRNLLLYNILEAMHRRDKLLPSPEKNHTKQPESWCDRIDRYSYTPLWDKSRREIPSSVVGSYHTWWAFHNPQFKSSCAKAIVIEYDQKTTTRWESFPLVSFQSAVALDFRPKRLPTPGIPPNISQGSMDKYNEFIPLFFDIFAKNFSEEQFLAMIQKGIPSTIVDQLTNDGQPDIGLSKDVTVDELLIPLSNKKMPKENLRNLRDMLSYYLIIFNSTYESEYVDPYKIIYIASLYVHCYIASGNCWEGDISMAAVGGLIAKASIQPQISHEMRAQVLKYLASVIPTVALDQTMYEFENEDSIYDERPYIGLSISFSVIFCAIFSQSLHFIEVPRTSGLPIPLNRSHGQPDERTVVSGYRLLATTMEDMERVIDQRLNLFFASLGWHRSSGLKTLDI